MAVPFATLRSCAVVSMLLLVCGCNGKPEDDGAGPAPAPLKTPAPPLPTWAAPMMGRRIADISKAEAVCKGMIDATVVHIGVRPGTEVEGWGWDEQGGRPLGKVLLTTADGRVVGAAAVGNLRPDVPKALSEVRTPAVGWKGVAEVTTGDIRAVGLTVGGSTCTLGETKL